MFAFTKAIFIYSLCNFINIHVSTFCLLFIADWLNQNEPQYNQQQHTDVNDTKYNEFKSNYYTATYVVKWQLT